MKGLPIKKRLRKSLILFVRVEFSLSIILMTQIDKLNLKVLLTKSSLFYYIISELDYTINS